MKVRRRRSIRPRHRRRQSPTRYRRDRSRSASPHSRCDRRSPSRSPARGRELRVEIGKLGRRLARCSSVSAASAPPRPPPRPWPRPSPRPPASAPAPRPAGGVHGFVPRPQPRPPPPPRFVPSGRPNSFRSCASAAARSARPPRSSVAVERDGLHHAAVLIQREQLLVVEVAAVVRKLRTDECDAMIGAFVSASVASSIPSTERCRS